MLNDSSYGIFYFSDGCTRSGLFCALRYVCDKINQEQSVDVFHAVKQIRLTRPEFIPNQVNKT